MTRDPLKRWERIIYIAVLVLALFTRFYMLGERAISHDESIHTKFSWNLYAGEGFQHNPMMHGPLLFEATALTYWLFGPDDFTSRLFVAALSVLLVMTPLLFRRWLGRAGAAATSVLLLISPSISYYGRYIRHDTPLMLTAVLLLWIILRFLDSGRMTWLAWLAAVFSLMYATKEASYIYTAIYLALLFVPFAVRILTVRWQRRDLYVIFLALVIVALALGLVFIVSFGQGQVNEIDLDEAGNSRVANVTIPSWGRVAALSALAALSAALVILRPGVGREALSNIRVFSVLMVIGTLTLPLGSAFLIKFAAGVDMEVVYEAVRTGQLDSVPRETLFAMFAVITVTAAVSVAFGLWWDRKHWPTIAMVHYTVFFVLYTTIFTWGFGALSGLVGGLAYWLAQQGVKRGNQPGYYYLLIGPLYEYFAIALAACGGVAALGKTLAGLRLSLLMERNRQNGEDEPDRGTGLGTRSLFPVFLLGWTVLSWIAYTYAGEKMPWLLVHIMLPSVFLGGWGLGQLLESLAGANVRSKPLWVFVISLPVVVVSLTVFGLNAATLSSALRSGTSAAGPSLVQLRALGIVLGGLAGVVLSGAAVGWAVKKLGVRRSLGLAAVIAASGTLALTVRTMVLLNFINYDMATEFLVYAHGTPDIKVALQQVREVSWRETGTAQDVRVAYGEDGSWPFTWYMVEFPNNYFYSMTPDAEQLLDCPVVIAGDPQYGAVEEILGDDYVHFDYKYLWWPIQDYYDLTPDRVRDALGDPDMRRALWDIVWSRDYAAYAALKSLDSPFDLQRWPYRKGFRLYVRREVAQEIWPTGGVAGVARYVEPVATLAPDPYGSGSRAIPQVSQVQLPGAVVRGIAEAVDGSLYVADTQNHRVWHLGPNGTIDSFGGYGSGIGQLNEPWDVAVGADGAIYVADTWNHRIQKFDSAYRPLTSWGGIVQVTEVGQPSAQGLFYGPRALDISPAGELYVADTGNKRVQVFDLDGNFLREFGGAGKGPGRLDEPVGLDVSAEGIVAVADTWNQRVQLFSDRGAPLMQWTIPTWDVTNPDEKPFLAWGPSGGTLLVTDPLRRRVLVFGPDGAYMWALSATAGANLAFPQGLLVAGDTLYVADAHDGEVLGYDLP